jgi:hypothetical protein
MSAVSSVMHVCAHYALMLICAHVGALACAWVLACSRESPDRGRGLGPTNDRRPLGPPTHHVRPPRTLTCSTCSMPTRTCRPLPRPCGPCLSASAPPRLPRLSWRQATPWRSAQGGRCGTRSTSCPVGVTRGGRPVRFSCHGEHNPSVRHARMPRQINRSERVS